MPKEQDQYAIPRFCPEGCGETLIATPLTPDEWEAMKSRVEAFGSTREESWHIKCSKCGYQSKIFSKK